MGIDWRRARSAEKRSECSSLIVGGEADQIVHDDVNGAAGGVAREVGVVHGLGGNALTGECGVAVDQQRQKFFAAAFAGAVLLGAGASDGDGIDRFQMAGVRDQVNVDLGAAARDVFAGCAQVILHVARAEDAARIDVFERGENFFGSAARDVQDHVQASAVTHAHNEIDGATLRGSVEDFVNQGKQRGIAFEREAFRAEVALLQHLLEDVGADEQVENALLVDGAGFAFHAFLDPAAAVGVGDVHELDADRAAIGIARLAGEFAVDLEVGLRLRTEEAEGVEVSLEVSPVPEKVENALAFRAGGFQEGGG